MYLKKDFLTFIKRTMAFLVLLMIHLSISAQQSTVRGKVTEQKTGEPLVGVTVFVQGTTIGATTDIDGNYSISVPAQFSSISFSFIGMVTQTIPVSGRSQIDVSMAEEILGMDEVVVVGYGTQKKVNLTGAVSQISSEVIVNRPAPNLTRLLQGALPNLNIKMVDGNPTATATYNIRGATSIGAGGSALVLIDGVEGDPNLVNPADVATVSILKDASSAAVYGSRAAFGVVLITTKTADKGKTAVNISMNQSVNSRTIVPDLITNGYEFAKNFDEAFFAWYDYKTHPTSVNATFPFSLDYLERLKERDENPSLPKVAYNESLGRYEYFGDTDWYDYLHKEIMPATDASITISGGSDKLNYLISGRYYYQDGIFEHSSDKYNKYNLRAKGEVKVNDWLSFQNNSDLSSFSYGYPLLANGDAGIWRYIAVQGFPMVVMNNPDGTYSNNGVYVGASFLEGNSRSEQTNMLIRNTSGLVATPFGDLLTLKADFTLSNNSSNDERYNNYVNFSNYPGHTARFGQSTLRNMSSSSFYWGSNITAELRKSILEVHNLGLLAGYNIESSSSSSLSTSRDGLLVEGKPDYNLMDGINYLITGGGSEWRYLGLFYRLTYNYKNRYLLEANGRYDGSSKFPINQRYGFFPSVSAGWNISDEQFMEGAEGWLDNLKLRASFGTLGNGNIAPYRFMETMTVSKASVILGGIQPGYTYLPAVLPDGLTWEKATTFNVGLDLTAFNNRATAVMEWYQRTTNDMFTLGQPLPNVFGATVPFGNYADMSTKGWEITLSWRDSHSVAGRRFNYSISGSLWDSRSFIIKYNNPTKSLAGTYYEGHEIGEIWGYTTLGLFASDEEVATHANQNFLTNSNSKQWLAGDLKFADLNDDGFINQGENTVDNPGDRKIIGNSSPRYQYGITLSASWNGFGTSAFLQGIGKRDWYFAPEADLFYGPYNRPYGFQPKIMMNDIWSEDNPDGYWPRFRGYTALGVTRSLGAPQTRYLQNAAYLRLKNISLDYSLPDGLLERLNLQNAKLYITGQNLLTWSKLFRHTKSFDPEIIENPLGTMTSSHGQGDTYPMLKTMTIGLNLTF
jgi:TonB-linked SusC/RagA family outer membrane protein